MRVVKVVYNVFCVGSIAVMILDTLKKSATDLRLPLASNIMLIGGCSSIIGLRQRLLFELSKRVENDNKYASLIGIENN